MAAPIYNPIIPCVHPIPGGMYPGRMIRVQGNVPPGGQRFAINFQCGPNTDPRDDIALHLNFRFMEMCVVRNHLTAMEWGVEETAGGIPIQRGEGFEALILCEPQSIKVALNGVHFCEFLHRVPFQRISHLTIDGDVHVQFIGFEGAPPPQQMYMAQPPAYGSYGAPPPAYGAPGYGAPQGFAPVSAPGAYQTTYAAGPQPRSGMGTGAAVGLGVGALAAGGLAGYALGGGFSSDSPTNEGYINNDNVQEPLPVNVRPPAEETAQNVEAPTDVGTASEVVGEFSNATEHDANNAVEDTGVEESTDFAAGDEGDDYLDNAVENTEDTAVEESNDFAADDEGDDYLDNDED